MSFLSILETVLIGPLKLVFEVIYVIANRYIAHPGLSIIVLSLIMNFLVLPLYKRADAMQEASREMEARLHDGVAHIKKTFRGDERMMILQTYYRQNNYKPTDAFRGSVSLLLEIPFFMAAYQFLSGLPALKGVSLGPIADLGAPDALLVIGGFTVNVLPVIMTLVNVVSSAVYLKGYPLKTKIQLYAMALFFLVFLYSSASGLVFYWTLNNLFSLAKNLFYKLEILPKAAKVLSSATKTLGRIPLAKPLLSIKLPAQLQVMQPNLKRFAMGGVFLTLLIGVFIPSVFISASPQEFINTLCLTNPLWYIVNTACLAAGTFLVWMGVFYWLAKPSGKLVFEKLIWLFCGITLINYMFFGTDLGIISANLQYESGMDFSFSEQLVNLFILIAVACVMYVIFSVGNRYLVPLLLVAAVALGGMSGVNIYTASLSLEWPLSELRQIPVTGEAESPSFQLSKTGENVVVIMLDRAMGAYIPYLFHENPGLQEQFSGFTYYSNTISFGGSTNFGSPALFGGYEYTPVEINKRYTESLVSKHNEALQVMPVLFSENGYDVTVCDPVYTNYAWLPDTSIYDAYPNIDAYLTIGMFSDPEQQALAVETIQRNFFCFSIMKTMPLFLQETLYNDGRYNQASGFSDDTISLLTQTAYGPSVSEGICGFFLDRYQVLQNLSSITKITGEDTNTFLLMANDITHQPVLLQRPEYVPAQRVDNTQFDAQGTNRVSADGKTLNIFSTEQMAYYHTNMAALIQLGNWFDYLRENDVYDNTRIILVSDHGRGLFHLEDLIIDITDDFSASLELFFPLLMVKDFNSEGFVTSEVFMTNADVPTLAFADLIEDPVNPFTGKAINSNEKLAHEQFITLSEDWDVRTNCGTTFYPSAWASVKDNLWDQNNWSFYDQEIILIDHAAP